MSRIYAVLEDEMHSSGLWSVCRLLCILCTWGVCAWGQSPATASDPADPIVSYEFLDLDDPCAVRDVVGKTLLTFGAFDANDRLLWARGFASLDAWRAFARNDPGLAGDKTAQPGWTLSGGQEDIFWHVQAIVYLCPEYRNVITAIESRPAFYDGDHGKWLVPGIAFTNRENRFDLVTATVFWNPNVSSAYGGASPPWDKFPPLVALAHELIHAYQRIVEDRPAYTSPQQVPAMKYENLVRHAFHRRVPTNEAVRPRPGNAGFYLGNEFQFLFDNLEWADWSPSYAPLLDVFEEP
jgi:hypothetical protein